MKRDHVVTVRLTAAEHEDLLHRARSRGLTVSRLIRMVLLRRQQVSQPVITTGGSCNCSPTITWRAS